MQIMHACLFHRSIFLIITTFNMPFFPSSLLCNCVSYALHNAPHMMFIMTFLIIQIFTMHHIIPQIIFPCSSLNRAYVHGCWMVCTDMFFIVHFVLPQGFFCLTSYGTFHIIVVLFISSIMLINCISLCLMSSLHHFHFAIFIVQCMILCM